MPRHQSLQESVDRRSFLNQASWLGFAAMGAYASGCVPRRKDGNLIPELVWGRRGFSEGRFQTPRALVISPEQEVYVVDKTGRIQVFDLEGAYQRSWRIPKIKQGKPTGLGWSNDGQLLVADTHYFRVLFYSPEGELSEERRIGGEHGDEPGQFHFVTDVVEDHRGHFFVGQYGQIDQIQEFGPDCEFIRRWGTQGEKLGEFSRPQCLSMRGDLLWVADACNHRVQIFDVSGEPELVAHWGVHGKEQGQLSYPYGLDFDREGNVWIAEFGNHRFQKFTPEGDSLAISGSAGQLPGQFTDPWALAFDNRYKLHVVDAKNNRLQRFRIG